MGTCVNHPEIESQSVCMKYSKHLCDQCATCQDPELYCKFRSACTIWFLEKAARRSAAKGRSS